MILLEVLLLSLVAVLSNLFRVLTGDGGRKLHMARPRFPVLFSLQGIGYRFFLATLARLHVAFSFISFAVVFHFLGIIKVGYGVAPRPYPIFSMICCLYCFLFFY